MHLAAANLNETQNNFSPSIGILLLSILSLLSHDLIFYRRHLPTLLFTTSSPHHELSSA